MAECRRAESSRDSNVVGNEDKILLALIMYVWPWLRGWRDLQMPILYFQGEPASGKTSMAELIQLVTTGKTNLQSLPEKYDDFCSILVNYGGALFFDNVGSINNKSAVQIQNLLSRIVTDPNGHITVRRLYRNLEVFKAPVQCCIGFTGIGLPFKQPDFLSRTLVFRFRASGRIDDDWVKRQFEKHGGREGWLAHHVVFLQHFFQTYDDHCKSQGEERLGRFRVKRFLRALETVAIVFKMDWRWIGPYLDHRVKETIRSSDHVIIGIEAFRSFWGYNRKFKVRDIVDFIETASSELDVGFLSENPILTHSWKLGQYISGHEQILRDGLGLVKLSALDHGAAQFVFESAEEV